MRLYGLLEQLTKISLTNGKNIEISPAVQSGDSDKVIQIPAITDANATQEMVLSKQAQTLTNKTIDADLNTVSNIANDEIKADAAIAGTKISPNFGAQNIDTTGNVGANILNATELRLLQAGSKLTLTADGAANALEVTQLGTGNVAMFLSQENSIENPALVTVIDSTGKVGVNVVGTAILSEALEVGAGNIGLDSAKGLVSRSASGTLHVGHDSNTSTVKVGTGANVASVEVGASGGAVTVHADSLDLESATPSLGLATGATLSVGDSSTTISTAGDIQAKDLVLTGNLTVQGTTTTVDTTNLEVKDKNITINNGGDATSAEGAGLSVEVDGSPAASLKYEAALTSKWKLGAEGSEVEVADVSSSQNLLNKVVSSTGAVTGALKLPVGDESQRPGTPDEGMIRYNSQSDSFEGYAAGAWAGIGGGGTVKKVAQSTTGLAVGDVMYFDGTDYLKAKADAANTAEVVGVISRVVDANNFELTMSGEVDGFSGLTEGEVYFLSADTAGAVTAVEPSVVGHISLPIGVASSETAILVAPKRGVVVGAANARTTIAVSNNAATNVVDVTNYNSLKLEGELNVTRSSGGNHRAYYTVEAAKNGAGVWQVSASYTGDDVLYTTLPSWDVSSDQLQVTMPNVTNFSSASLTYALGAPAVGASLPLSIDSSSINIVESAPLSNRNVLINGNFDIWQRGTSQTSSGYGSDDRWENGSGGSTKTHSQQAFALGQTEVPGNPKYFSRTVVSSVAGASNLVSKNQKIESVTTLAGQTATLSFWAKADAPKNIAIEFAQNFGTGGSPSARVTAIGVTTIALTTSWKKYTVTVDIPSVAGKTLGTDGKDSLQLNMWFDAGSGYDNRTNSLGQQSGTFDIAQVQLEAGSKATAFEKRPIQQELALCQRYFQVFGGIAGSSPFMQGYGIVGQTIVYAGVFPVEMRTIPSASVNGTWQLANCNKPTSYVNTTKTFTLRAVLTVTATAYFFPGGSGDTCTYDAEL